MRTYGWLLSALLVAGCTQPNPAFDPDPYLPGECREGVEVSETFDAFERPDKLDVLFVVDSSGDVADLQKMVARAMPQFAALLKETGVDGAIAVTTTDPAAGETLSEPVTGVEGCADNSVSVARTSDSNWSEAVACNLQQGNGGGGFDQPIGVIDTQLAAGPGEEFFRPDARLLVVVLTKNDDCTTSASPSGDPGTVCGDEDALVDVAETVAQWRKRRQTTDSLALAVFGGPPSRIAAEQGRPVCNSTIGAVEPGNRLYRATRALGDLGFYFSACTDDAFAPLATVVDRFVDDATVTLCPGAELEHEPLSVVASTEDEGQESVPFGPEGFVYLGATDLCAEGALEFAGDAVRGVEQIDVEYCTLP
jgi:hypothetical protein